MTYPSNKNKHRFHPLGLRDRKGLTLVEVILAFTLLLLFMGGIVQVMSYQATTALYSTMKEHFVNQNRMLGNFLASYTGDYDPKDTRPIGTAGAMTSVNFPYSTVNPLGFAGIRLLDAKTDQSSLSFVAANLTLLCVEYDTNGLWSWPTASYNLSDAGVVGQNVNGVTITNWVNYSSASGCAVNCDPAVTPTPTDTCCISLVNFVKRTNYAATYSACTLAIGGGGSKTRASTPLGSRTADGAGLIYELRLFKEKVQASPKPSIRIRVWMRLDDSSPASRAFEGRPPLTVETVYQKHS